MKIEIIIDENYDETTLKVYANSMNDDVKLIESFFYENTPNRIVGFKDDEAYVLYPENIIRFFTEDKTTYIQTKTGKLISRLRMYEIEDRFRSSNFIKISRGEILNLDYVKRLDLSFKGTIAVELKNGDVTYVSRRNLGNFKKTIGL